MQITPTHAAASGTFNASRAASGQQENSKTVAEVLGSASANGTKVAKLLGSTQGVDISA